MNFSSNKIKNINMIKNFSKWNPPENLAQDTLNPLGKNQTKINIK